MLGEIHLEAVDHVLADLGEDARRRRDETDVEILSARRCAQAGQRKNGTEQ